MLGAGKFVHLFIPQNLLRIHYELDRLYNRHFSVTAPIVCAHCGSEDCGHVDL